MAVVYTRAQVAKIIGVHPKTISKWVNELKFDRPCTPEGHHPRWTQEAIDNYVNSRPITAKEKLAKKALAV